MQASPIVKPIPSAAALLASAFLSLALLAPAPLRAQAAPSAQTLAKYDRNNNGRLDPDETAAMQADQARAAQTPVTSSPSSSGDVVELNPFSVDASKDIGYYAENTLAGSRLNTNVGDLAASITVVTKQQLDDTGALNINDVFLYEANTEGAGNYTPTFINRGSAADAIAGYSGDDGSPFTVATANRVRGLGSADTAQNNYPTIARLAFDSYNTNSVEINRGPNSMLFGTGGASGIINQSTAEAVLNKNKTTINLRVGSNDAHRESISQNVPVGKKVALYVAALYDAKGYPRKPSGDITRRQYAAITYQPFSKTKITGSFENYDNYNNRPNQNDPGDYVTPWYNATGALYGGVGKPGWDPTTQTVTFANGVIAGPFLNSTLDPRWHPGLTSNGTGAFTSSTSANYISDLSIEGHVVFGVDHGQIVNAFAPNGSAGAGVNGSVAIPAVTARTAAQWIAQNIATTQTSGAPLPLPPASTGATSYVSGNTYFDKGVTNKAIYDWTKYNSLGANYGTQNARSFNIEFNQQILSGLNLNIGWFRQEMRQWDHYPLGQANGNANRIFVDTNTKLMDGRPNPYFGAPYVYDYQAATFNTPENNNNLRALLAYDLDLAKNQGWTRFLGRHRFLALASEQKDWSNRLKYTLSFDGGDPRFLINQNPAIPNNYNWSSNPTIERHYYMGDNNNGQVTRGVEKLGEPNFGGPGKVNMSYFDWNSTMTWQSTQMTMDPNLLFTPLPTGVNYKILDSTSFAYQGWLWKNRLIPTAGTRYDKARIYTYSGTSAPGVPIPTQVLYTNGFGNAAMSQVVGNPPYDVGGNTTTLGIVARPFSGWRAIDAAAERGSFLADFVRGLGFTYNHSDNFTTPSNPTTDYYGKILPKPSGTGKDIGISGSMFNNKLSWSLKWYEQNAINAVSNAASTVGTLRVPRIDISSTFAWARLVVRVRAGQDPTSQNFDNNTVFPLTDAQQMAINALVAGPEVDASGKPVVAAFTVGNQLAWPNTSIQSTNSQESKGLEASLVYNPKPNWNIKMTLGQQRSTYSKAVGEITSWLYGSGDATKGDGRLNFWQNLAAPDLPLVYTRFNGNKLYLGQYWSSYGYGGDANSNTTGATSTPSSTYFGIVDSGLHQLAGLQGQRSPSEREWNSSVISNYSFTEGKLRGWAIGGSLRWASNAVVGYYGSLDPATWAHPTPDQNQIVSPDITKPIYTPATTNVDAWISYTTRFGLLGKNVRAKFQLNVRSLTEDGELRPLVYNADGTAAQYTIVDPRTWFLSTTFDF
jgi:hypothetical protein